ncbi:MAG: hypothetical protein D6819_05975 [Gammaproteobacteria bacterium]|nr:MAG: hypothetical protein D6819_05975 [Gammaproteobacteria bacterium]
MRLDPRALEERLAAPMFFLSLAFLVLTAIAIQRFQRPELDAREVRFFLMLYGILWIPFITECALHLMLAGRPDRRQIAQALLICLLPPLRLGARRFTDPGAIWLPGLGWQRVNHALYVRLERAFSLPMIFIALLILPVLATEYYLWKHQVAPPLWLAVLLDVGTAVIWLAFAVEFILMVSVAHDKLQYIRKHWLELAIILLPLLAFLRGFQAIRLLRLSRLMRVYRLRGVATKGFRALVLLDAVQRILNRNPQKRLKRLYGQVAERELELERLYHQIHLIERSLAERGDPPNGMLETRFPSEEAIVALEEKLHDDHPLPRDPAAEGIVYWHVFRRPQDALAFARHILLEPGESLTGGRSEDRIGSLWWIGVQVRDWAIWRRHRAIHRIDFPEQAST